VNTRTVRACVVKEAYTVTALTHLAAAATWGGSGITAAAAVEAQVRRADAFPCSARDCTMFTPAGLSVDYGSTVGGVFSTRNSCLVQ
jgi:hypothetical protein